jgi:hypothetical protein
VELFTVGSIQSSPFVDPLADTSGVDERRGRDAGQRRNIGAAPNVWGIQRLSPGGLKALLPKGRGRGSVCVKTVDAVVFGGHIHHIVHI